MLHLLLLVLLGSAQGGTEDFTQTDRILVGELHRAETPPAFLRLPVFVDSKRPLVNQEQFSPGRGTGLEPLPDSLREVLLPGRTDSSPRRDRPAGPVRTLCEENRMQVQVQRSVLGTGDARAQLSVGTCHASKSTKDSVYFEFELSDCGTKNTVINNQVVFTNTLRYDPPKLQGPIRRAAGFTLPVSCYFNRFQYSYKVGFTPKVQTHRVFKQMRNAARFVLTPRTAQWERLLPSEAYVLGQPMYFEAAGPHLSEHERLYVRSCFATPEKSHTSTPQFPVVKNFGCMVESKDGRSRFIPYGRSAVRFSVDAFLFKAAPGQQLYMHCSMSVGSSAPTPTAKSCNYNTSSSRWEELFGPHSVCSCCDSNCSSAASTETEMIRSRLWTVELKVRPPIIPERKTFSTTTAEVTEPRRPETTAGSTQQEVELQRPTGGGVEGEEEEEDEVKGSAVVEEEVTEPHRIFEEIFVFGK